MTLNLRSEEREEKRKKESRASDFGMRISLESWGLTAKMVQ